MDVNLTDTRVHRMHTVVDLDDLLAGASHLEAALRAGLAHLELGRVIPGGAIYLSCTAAAPEKWVPGGISQGWLDQMNSEASPLAALAQRVAASGEGVVGEASLGLLAALPLRLGTDTLGVLLIEGSLESFVEPANLGNWLMQCGRYAHSFAWTIRAFRTRDSFPEKDQNMRALQLLETSLNTNQDGRDHQIHFLRGMLDFYQAEAVVLVLLDLENGGKLPSHQKDQAIQLAIKKVVYRGMDDYRQACQPFSPGLVLDCLTTRRPIHSVDVSQDARYSALFDGIDGLDDVGSLLCLPLTMGDQVLGVVEVLNGPGTPLSDDDLHLAVSFGRWLANNIYSFRLIQELKVANADLEASRWELLHSRNTLRALFDSIPASMYIIDRDYTLLAVNRSRSERVGSKPNHLVGKRCYAALAGETDPCPGCRVREVFFKGRGSTRSTREWLDSERVVEWDVSAFPILDGTNLPVQAILLEQDITEKRRLEADLVQSEKLAAVGQLAAGVAHEINNPLAAIIANAQMLMRDLPTQQEEALESVRLIEQAGVRASQVVRNLLNFARKEQFEFAMTDVNHTILEAMSFLQHEFISHPIQLRYDLAADLPLVKASRDHLQGVWINIVMNAIDALDNRAGEISIGTQLVSDELKVTIADSGKGIPPDRVSRIFEPFFTTKSAGHGTGLGLSVCHRIIKQHGGSIQVESQLGVGTRLNIFLPLY